MRECRLVAKCFLQFCSCYSNPFIWALWFSGGKPGLFQHLLGTRSLCKLDSIPKTVTSSKHKMHTRCVETSQSIVAAVPFPQYLLLCLWNIRWTAKQPSSRTRVRQSTAVQKLFCYYNCPSADALTAQTASACRLFLFSQDSLLQQLCRPDPPVFSSRCHKMPDILKPLK